LFPQLTPATDLGAAGIAGYAARQGVSVETFTKNFEPVLTPGQVGGAVVDLVRAADDAAREFLISGRGLWQVP
jgi:hypothetical protein